MTGTFFITPNGSWLDEVEIHAFVGHADTGRDAADIAVRNLGCVRCRADDGLAELEFCPGTATASALEAVDDALSRSAAGRFRLRHLRNDTWHQESQSSAPAAARRIGSLCRAGAAAYRPSAVATVGECLALLADGETLARLLDGRWVLTGTVDLRVARTADASLALALIERGYVAELPRRSIAGSVAEYDLTPAGQAAADRVLDSWTMQVVEAERQRDDASRPSRLRRGSRRRDGH